MLTKTLSIQPVCNALLTSALLVAGALLVTTSPAAAADDSGQVGGDVPAVNTIDFTPATGPSTAITNGAAAASYPMGTLAITNNDPDGWTLDVASTNGGELQNGAHAITYTDLTVAAIAGATVTPVDLATPATPEEVIDAVYGAEVAEGVSGVAVTASIASGQYVPAGTYTDTLTFTLTSK